MNKNANLKILIVEDDPVNLKLLEATLKKIYSENVDILSASSLKETIELLSQEFIAVALVDLNLSDSSGLDTSKAIQEKAPNLPVIIITGTDDDGLGVKAVASGAQDYLVKGDYNDKILSKSINYSIYRKKIEQSLHEKTEALTERIKEINCLYSLFKMTSQHDMSIEDIFKSTVNLLVKSWNYPQFTSSRIVYEQKQYATDNFRQTQWFQSEPISNNGKKIGAVEVYFLTDDFQGKEKPFLPEEDALLKAVAEHLSATVDNRKTQQALKESEAKFRALFDSANDAIVILTADDYRFFDCNNKTLEVFGGNRQDILGHFFFEFSPHQHDGNNSKEKISSIIANVLSGHSQNFEWMLCRCDKTHFFAEMSMSKVDLYGKDFVQIVIHDITNRKEMEEKLLFFQSFVDESEEGMGWADIDGNIRYANASLCSMFGVEDFSKIEGKPVLDFYDKDTQERLKNEIFPSAMQNGFWAGDLPVISSDGKKIITSNSLFVLRDKSGRPVAFGNVLTDLTERKKQEAERILLEKQLNNAQKLEAIGTLAAGIAHEINTPIQFISDNTRFFDDGIKDIFKLIEVYGDVFKKLPEQCVDLVKQVRTEEENVDFSYLREEIPKALLQTQEGLARVAKIVMAMKDFSHMDGEEMVNADINKAVETTAVISRNEWKYVADLKTEIDPNLPPVYCFINDISQVIMNLIINASHAIDDVLKSDSSKEKKGRIVIKTSYNDKKVVLSVTDTGTGIPEKVRPKIFDPFFTTKEVGKGTGQGLSMAYSLIVEKHGGNIFFETEIGKGTTFFIELPINKNKGINNGG